MTKTNGMTKLRKTNSQKTGLNKNELREQIEFQVKFEGTVYNIEGTVCNLEKLLIIITLYKLSKVTLTTT